MYSRDDRPLDSRPISFAMRFCARATWLFNVRRKCELLESGCVLHTSVREVEEKDEQEEGIITERTNVGPPRRNAINA